MFKAIAIAGVAVTADAAEWRRQPKKAVK
jgi:hypothetical protein